jgi:predicted metal-dependent hydrolase
MQQMILPFRLDERFLCSYLEGASRRTISLVITDNSTSVLSIKEKGETVVVRLHRMFLSAEYRVLDEMADFIKNRKKSTPLVRKFINQNTHYLKKRPPRKIQLRSAGKRYNLLDLFHSINREYFGRSASASITWGQRKARRSAGERTLGSYNHHDRVIKINPILDSDRVPRYFLEFVIYHEMLHADIGIEDGSGRRELHSREFRKREKLFRHYEKASAWEKKRWG